MTPKEFRATIMSHGYFWLRPVIGTENPPSILIPYDLRGRVGCAMITTSEKNVHLEHLSGTEGDALGIATLCLSLDDDLKKFKKIARTSDDWKWLLDEKKGRFLRSPSLFEDCLKAIFTININWKRSQQMARDVVSKFGLDTKIDYNDETVRACPTPERLAELDVDELKSEINCGFRAKFIHSLCDTAIENPDVYSGYGWNALSADEFCDEIGSVSGMGPMSVAYVSRLYGKTNSYHMDSFVVRRCAELWGIKESRIEKHVKRRYGDFGDLGPAVFWFELTRHWHYSDEEAIELDL